MATYAGQMDEGLNEFLGKFRELLSSFGVPLPGKVEGPPPVTEQSEPTAYASDEEVNWNLPILNRNFGIVHLETGEYLGTFYQTQKKAEEGFVYFIDPDMVSPNTSIKSLEEFVSNPLQVTFSRFTRIFGPGWESTHGLVPQQLRELCPPYPLIKFLTKLHADLKHHKWLENTDGN